MASPQRGLAGRRGRGAGRCSRATAGGRSARSAHARRAQLPRDEERHLRRGRRAARQRPGARRARRDRPREGHEPQPLLPRPGRQVHLGRRRLVVSCRARSTPRSSGRSSRRPTRSPTRRLAIWDRYHERFAALEAARARCAGRSCRTSRAPQRAHVLRAPARRRAARTRSSSSSPRAASTPSSTTCRCTARRRDVGTAGRARSLPVTDDVSERLVRLPLWVGMTDDVVQAVIEAVATAAGG